MRRRIPRAAAFAAVVASAGLLLSGCWFFGGPAPAPTTDTPATSAPDPTPEQPAAAPLNCANVLRDPAAALEPPEGRATWSLKAQWGVRGGDYTIDPLPSMSSGGDFVDSWDPHAFPIERGIRCQARPDDPSGWEGYVYEYVEFDPAHREGVLAYLESTGFTRTDFADGTVAFDRTHESATDATPNAWYLGDGWLAAGLSWPRPSETGETEPAFLAEPSDATTAEHLPEERQRLMCAAFFGEMDGATGAILTPFFDTGFLPYPVEEAPLVNRYSTDGAGCESIEWIPASAAELEAAAAEFGDPVATTPHSRVHAHPDGGFAVLLDTGWAHVRSALEIAELVLEPVPTYRPLH